MELVFEGPPMANLHFMDQRQRPNTKIAFGAHYASPRKLTRRAIRQAWPGRQTSAKNRMVD